MRQFIYKPLSNFKGLFVTVYLKSRLQLTKIQNHTRAVFDESIRSRVVGSKQFLCIQTRKIKEAAESVVCEVCQKYRSLINRKVGGWKEKKKSLTMQNERNCCISFFFIFLSLKTRRMKISLWFFNIFFGRKKLRNLIQEIIFFSKRFLLISFDVNLSENKKINKPNELSNIWLIFCVCFFIFKLMSIALKQENERPVFQFSFIGL